MTRAILFAALLLSACSGPFGASPRLTAPYKFGDKGDLVDFNYAWSAEASAIPALETRFRAALDKVWREKLAAAVADRARAVGAKRPYNGHQYSFEWITAGQSRRLLSLEGLSRTLTGDLRANHASAGLLWDRRISGSIAVSSLLTDPARLLPLIRATTCASLDRERAKRRAVATAASACPRLDRLTIVPVDTNANARFDQLRVTADPGVAGSIAEGFYQVEVPLTRAFVAALKPVYRSSFEAA